MENKCDLAEYLHISESKIEVIYNPINKEKIKKMRFEELPDTINKRIQ